MFLYTYQCFDLKRQKTGLAFSIWLGASFHESDGVLDELPAGLHELHNLIHPDARLETEQNIRTELQTLNILIREQNMNHYINISQEREYITETG